MDKFVTLLGEALDKLGLTAAYLWPHAVKYTFFEALAAAVGWSLFGVVVLYTARLLRQRAEERSNNRNIYDSDITGALRGLSVAILALGWGIILLAIFVNISTLIEPEYAAVLQLLGAVGAK